MTFWTESRVEQLRKEHRQGRSFTEIAESLGCTKSAARGKADRLGLCGERPGIRETTVYRKMPPPRREDMPPLSLGGPKWSWPKYIREAAQ